MSENDYEITDYNYIGSSIGNAFFSGLSFEQLWNCVALSENREQLDAAVSATITMNELIKGEKNV
jgi:hypothetical protein